MISIDSNLKDRLTWKGLQGDEFYPSIAITKFIKETNPFNRLAFHSSSGLFDASVQIAKTYCNWCKEKKACLTDNELRDLFAFFIGAIGEVFMLIIADQRSKLFVPEKKTLFTFTGLKVTDCDYGVDLYGKVSTVKDKSYDCVIQCKFWSPNSDKCITATILQKALADGLILHYIKENKKNNVFIFWLGDDSHVTKYCKDYPGYNHAVFIDKKVLDYNFKHDDVFWKVLKDELNNLGNL